MKLSSLLLLPTLAILFSACRPIGQAQVLDRATRQPIAGAMVRAKTSHLTTPFEVQIQETDAQGVAKFQGSGASTIFTVGKPGYLPTEDNMDLGPALLERGTVYPTPRPGKTERFERYMAEEILINSRTSLRGSIHDPGHTPPELWERWERYLKTFQPVPLKDVERR